MTEDKSEPLLREALALFLDVREHPQDEAALRARDAFLARGVTERKAYETAVKAWSAGRVKPSSKIDRLIAAFAVLSSALFFASGEIRVRLLADASTGHEMEQVSLLSGDVVQLDAASAIRDQTEGDIREVTLLEGAGFFDVETSDVPFVVAAGDVTVQVLGTAFEVSHLDDAVLVAVAEGAVKVTAAGQHWQLVAGQRLVWLDDSSTTEADIAAEDVAGWRNTRFTADGMTFAQVLSILDRRLPGKMIVADSDLASVEITGSIDLERPEAALQALLFSVDAQIYELQNVVSVIRR